MKYMFLYIYHLILKSIDFNSSDESFVFVFISVFFSFIWFGVKFRVKEAIKNILIVEPVHLFFPFSTEFHLIGVSIKYIKCLWSGVLEALGLLIILGLGALKALCLGLLWLWTTLLELLFVVTVSIFYISANGPIRSPSNSLYFWWCCVPGVGCSCAWGSILFVVLK